MRRASELEPESGEVGSFGERSKGEFWCTSAGKHVGESLGLYVSLVDECWAGMGRRATKFAGS